MLVSWRVTLFSSTFLSKSTSNFQLASCCPEVGIKAAFFPPSPKPCLLVRHRETVSENTRIVATKCTYGLRSYWPKIRVFSHVLQPTCVKIRGRWDNFLSTKCRFIRQFPKYLVICASRKWRESGNIHLAINRPECWVLDGKPAAELCSVKVTKWPIDLQRMWAKSSRTQQVPRNKKCKHSQWSIATFEHGQMVGTIHIEKHTVKVYRGHMGSCLNHAEIGRNLPVSSDLQSMATC